MNPDQTAERFFEQALGSLHRASTVGYKGLIEWELDLVACHAQKAFIEECLKSSGKEVFYQAPGRTTLVIVAALKAVMLYFDTLITAATNHACKYLALRLSREPSHFLLGFGHTLQSSSVHHSRHAWSSCTGLRESGIGNPHRGEHRAGDPAIDKYQLWRYVRDFPKGLEQTQEDTRASRFLKHFQNIQNGQKLAHDGAFQNLREHFQILATGFLQTVEKTITVICTRGNSAHLANQKL